MPGFALRVIRHLALTLLAAAWVSAGAQAQTVRVGVYDNAPKVFWEGGSPRGLFIDILQAIARDEGWTLSFVACEWQACLDGVRSGRIDLMPDVAHTAERETYFDFPPTPVLHSWSQVYTRADHPIVSVLDLQGRSAALLDGGVQVETFKTLVGGFGLTVRLQTESNLGAVFAAAQAGSVDAAVANNWFGQYNAGRYGLVESPVVFQPARLHIVAARGQHADWLTAVDQHLRQWQADNRSVYYDILRQWRGRTELAATPWRVWVTMAGLGALALLAMVVVVFLGRQVLINNRQLRQEHARMQAILEAMPDLLFEIDLDGRYLDVHAPREELLAAPRPDLLGRTVAEVMPAEAAETVMAALRGAHAQGFSSGLRLSLPLGDGAHWFELSVARKEADGKSALPSFIVLSRDVTDSQNAHQALKRSEDTYRALFESSPVPLLVYRKDRSVMQVNTAFVQAFGYTQSDITTLGDWQRMVYPDAAYREAVLQTWTAHNADSRLHGTPFEPMQVRIQAKDGGLHEVRVSKVAIGDLRLAVLDDISEISAAQDDLKEHAQRQLLALNVFNYAREGIVVTDPQGIIVDCNASFSRLTGYPREELLGTNPRLLSSGRYPQAFYNEMWDTLLTQGFWEGELWNRRKDGTEFAEHLTMSAVRGPDGSLQSYVGIVSDVTAVHEHRRQLEHVAYHDRLTGLPNRVLLADRLQLAMTQCGRRDQSLAVAYLDLDGFKAINDTHGHATGDQVLVALADRMRQALREGDTLSRFGGDEFVVVLPDVGDTDSLEPVLHRLLHAAAEPVVVDTLALQVSASIGVTVYPRDPVDADMLLRHADQAMYQAKQSGKNRYQFFDIEHAAAIQSRLGDVQAVQAALKAGEFVLYYQPQVDAHTDAVLGFEALIRWQHPVRGLLMPDQFLPAVEGHLVSVELDEWVVHAALSQMAQWLAQGLSLPVSVNVSATQLQQERFPERLRAALAKHPTVPADLLKLEVLETSALLDLDAVSAQMHACMSQGVVFALDDFGTGYSSLAHLRKLPVQQLKIDRSFVRDMLVDPEDLAIIEGIVGLARIFGREVIAEGVETLVHAQRLTALGCSWVQGYGIARPMPAQSVATWVEQWRAQPLSSTVSRTTTPSGAV